MPEKKKEKKDSCEKACSNIGTRCTMGGIYCLGFIGAAIYYISTSTGFWSGVWGVLKALVWPAFLVFEAMKFLGM
ncbi:MAG: hypothetical protein ACOCXG_00105 [Nanoarchaeota archaeon]